MKKTILAAAMLMALASPALAGTITFSNGQGVWQSTNCPQPMPPSVAHVNSETAASRMNGVVVNYNEYSQQQQAYMNCLTREAKMDADAAGSIVMQSLAGQVQAAQDTLVRERSTMYLRR